MVTIHIALIPPACQLQRTLGREYQMILPDLAGLSEYHKQYMNMTKSFTILDNGAFESESIDAKMLLRMAEEYQVDEVVAPDTIGDAEASRHQLAEFMSMYRHPSQRYRCQIMAVIQGKSLHECKTYIDIIGVWPGIDTLGIPKHLPATTGRDDARTKLVAYAQMRYPQIRNIHCLGFVSPSETMMLADLGVRSMDTTAPFVCTVANISIGGNPDTCTPSYVPPRPDDYPFLAREYFHPTLLHENIERLDKWAAYDSFAEEKDDPAFD